jgi:hypothetical protein
VISASTFTQHSSIWAVAAPTLDQAVRMANSMKRSTGKGVRPTSDASRSSLISETAFLLAKAQSYERNPNRGEAEKNARAFLLNLPRSEKVVGPLNGGEWEEVAKICGKITQYTNVLSGVEFSPLVPGCGVVDQAVADVVADRELIEVKAVRRPFRASDIRQLLTYLAMFYAKGVVFDRVTLLNPRSSSTFTVSLIDLSSVSSGKAPVELLQELVSWMIGLQVSA